MKKPDRVPFIQELHVLRRSRGLTQTQMASELGISRRTYLMFEKMRWWPQPRAQADFVKRLRDLDPAAARAFVELIGAKVEDYVPVAPVPSVGAGAPIHPLLAQLVFDSAVLGAAEQLDLSPRVLRPILAATLERLVASDMPLSQAASLAKAALAAPLAGTRDKA